MKRKEIKVGGVYVARVSGKLTDVRVDAIREKVASNSIGSHRDVYDATNLATGRKLTFRSAQKFRYPADAFEEAMFGEEDTPPAEAAVVDLNKAIEFSESHTFVAAGDDDSQDAAPIKEESSADMELCEKCRRKSPPSTEDCWDAGLCPACYREEFPHAAAQKGA